MAAWVLPERTLSILCSLYCPRTFLETGNETAPFTQVCSVVALCDAGLLYASCPDGRYLRRRCGQCHEATYSVREHYYCWHGQRRSIQQRRFLSDTKAAVWNVRSFSQRHGIRQGCQERYRKTRAINRNQFHDATNHHRIKGSSDQWNKEEPRTGTEYER